MPCLARIALISPNWKSFSLAGRWVRAFAFDLRPNSRNRRLPPPGGCADTVEILKRQDLLFTHRGILEARESGRRPYGQVKTFPVIPARTLRRDSGCGGIRARHYEPGDSGQPDHHPPGLFPAFFAAFSTPTGNPRMSHKTVTFRAAARAKILWRAGALPLKTARGKRPADEERPGGPSA